MRRQFLGTVSTVMFRRRVYLAGDAVEVDEIEGYTGTRRRVLLDEVLAVTLDRRRRWVTILIWLAFGAVFLLPWLFIGLNVRRDQAALVGAVFAAIFGGPFFLLAVMHLIAGADCVTVFGKRGVAQVAFTLRKRHAREVFALLRERTQQAQDRGREASGETRTA
jgi:hypothetical protein